MLVLETAVNLFPLPKAVLALLQSRLGDKYMHEKQETKQIPALALHFKSKGLWRFGQTGCQANDDGGKLHGAATHQSPHGSSNSNAASLPTATAAQTPTRPSCEGALVHRLGLLAAGWNLVPTTT